MATDSLLGAAPNEGLSTDSLLGAAPHEGLLTLFRELPIVQEIAVATYWSPW